MGMRLLKIGAGGKRKEGNELGLEIFNDVKLSFISVLLLEGIYFYNFTSPEFNVNVAQLPFWSITAYFTWKIYKIFGQSIFRQKLAVLGQNVLMTIYCLPF